MRLVSVKDFGSSKRPSDNKRIQSRGGWIRKASAKWTGGGKRWRGVGALVGSSGATPEANRCQVRIRQPCFQELTRGNSQTRGRQLAEQVGEPRFIGSCVPGIST